MYTIIKMFGLIARRLTDTEHVRASAQKIEENTDVYTQFGSVLKQNRSKSFADDYVMAAFAYYEIDDLESAQRCFMKADMTLMLSPECKTSRDVYHFLYNFVQHKRGLGDAPTLAGISEEWLLRTIACNNDIPKLGHVIKTTFGLRDRPPCMLGCI